MIFCNHESGVGNFEDSLNHKIIGSWCYKCHKVWFIIPKGQHPNEVVEK